MSRLFLSHETIILPNNETPITNRPRRIRPYTGIGRRVCGRTNGRATNIRKGLGETGRNNCTLVQPDGNIFILGRPATTTKLLQGHISSTSGGQGIELFTGAQLREFGEVCSSLTTTDTMVIRPKSPHVRLQESLSYLNCRRAVNFLIYTFGGRGDFLVFAGEVITVGRLLAEQAALANAPAKNCYVKFWGGPPSSVGFFSGTLLTALCDRIMNTTRDNNWAIYNLFLDLERLEYEEEFSGTS